jgi:hypothetical protein
MTSLFVLLISVVQASALAGADSWTPPIGIPEPSFGIEETYRMYDEPSARNPNLTYYASVAGGYYTHYIDYNHPSSTDSSNTYGSPSKPRSTIPKTPPAGSVIEVHNTVRYSGPSGEVVVGGEGTADMPIFVRGVGMPRTELIMQIGHYSKAKYLIVEGLSFGNFTVLAFSTAAFTNSYVSIRDCDFYGTTFGASTITSYSSNPYSNPIENIVVYNNKVHDHGEWNYTGSEDKDKGGIFLQNRISNIWVVDNEIYHVQGTGIGCGPQPQNYAVDNPIIGHHIYIGRNLIYQNNQTGIWTKTARDVIFSQNIIWGHRASVSSPGGGFGFQYDPQRIWFLFNRAYDNSMGLDTGSGNLGGGNEAYIIGNLIYDCTNESYYPTATSGAGDGMQINGRQDITVMFNTISDCYRYGIYNKYYSTSSDIFNNIISGCPTTIDYLTAQTSSPSLSTFDYNLLYGGNIKWNTTYANLAAFKVGTTQGDNCIEANPLFVDPAKGDFSLQPGSPVNSLETSDKVQAVFDRFAELYGIDLQADIEGIERTVVTPPVVPAAGVSGDTTASPVVPDAGVISETSTSPVVDSTVSNPVTTEPPQTQVETPVVQTESQPQAAAQVQIASQPVVQTSTTSAGTTTNGKKDDHSHTATTNKKIKSEKIYQRYDQIYGSGPGGRLNLKQYNE